MNLKKRVKMRHETDGFSNSDDSALLTDLDLTDDVSIALQERCSCGTSYESSWPAKLADLATKQINTWRRFHVCTNRSETTQPTARP